MRPVLLGAWLLGGVLGSALVACVRHADIRDEPDAATIDPTPQPDAGEIATLDSGLESDAHPPCGERPLGGCVGSNDFPCAFEGWATSTAQSCQEQTGCKTNGWVEIRMSAEGCVTEIGMDQPNDTMVECLVAAYGSVRCPCGEGETSHYFGEGNEGPCP